MRKKREVRFSLVEHLVSLSLPVDQQGSGTEFFFSIQTEII